MYYLVRNLDDVRWPLGEASFNKFYAEDGWIILESLIKNNEVGILETLHIRRDDTPDKMEIEEFLEEIKNYQILLDI